MAGGPIFPHSTFPVDTSGRLFPNVYVGGGANSKQDVGMGVKASLDADAIWRLRFQCPPTLPTGTGKLLLRGLANASTGNAKVNPKWASVAGGESPSAATLNAEGVSTITWSAVDVYVDTKITLDADTLVGGEVVVMDLTFETASWTLAQVSTWQPFLIWE